jgi:hypothetical protein
MASYYTANFYFLLILLKAGLALADSANSTAGSHQSVTLTEANDGASTKIVAGTILNIFLKVPPEEVYKSSCHWSKLRVSHASVLKEIQRAVLLPTGVTAGFFRANQPGVVQIDSFRHNCTTGDVIRWHVEVRVTY